MKQKKIEKIMLIKPSNTIAKDSIRRLLTPLSLLYIGGVLKDSGYKVKILDSTCEGYYTTIDNEDYYTYGLNDKEIMQKVKDYKPDLVGVTSMFSSQQKNALHHCDLIKKVDKEIPVVIGGIHSSLFPEETMKYDFIDFSIIGEGEYRLANLIKSLNEGKNPEFDGIAYKKNGVVKINPMTKRIEDLDSLPFPARELINMKKYIEIGLPIGPFTRKERVEQVMTSRGCPFYCNFCSSANYFGRKFRMRSVDNIIQEIEGLIDKYKIQEIQFPDDNLTLNKKRAKNLFKRLKDYNLSWCTPNGIMIKTLDEEMIKLMAESGLYQITFAIESGSQRVLKKIIHKSVPEKKHVKKLINLCQDYGVHTHGTLIIGFPRETKEEIFETLNYPFDSGLDSVSYFVANPIPGSELYDECKEKGYLKESNKMDVKSAEIHIPKNSPEYVFSTKKLEELVENKTREFNEFSKKKHPERWKKKFEQFLKKHGENEDLIFGRVT